MIEETVVEQRLRDALTAVAETDPISAPRDLDAATVVELTPVRTRRHGARAVIAIAAVVVLVVGVVALANQGHGSKRGQVEIQPVALPDHMVDASDLVRYTPPPEILHSPNYPAFGPDDSAACDQWAIRGGTFTCNHIVGWIGTASVTRGVAVDTLYLDQIPYTNITIEQWKADNEAVSVDGKRGWIHEKTTPLVGTLLNDRVELVIEEAPGRYAYVVESRAVTNAQLPAHSVRTDTLAVARSLRPAPVGVSLPLVATRFDASSAGAGGWIAAGKLNGQVCFMTLPSGSCQIPSDKEQLGEISEFGSVVWARSPIVRVQVVVPATKAGVANHVTEAPPIATGLDLGQYRLFLNPVPGPTTTPGEFKEVLMGYGPAGAVGHGHTYAQSCTGRAEDATLRCEVSNTP